MALNIKDPETERLAAEIAALTGESKTGAIRVALRERKERLALQDPADRGRMLRRWLEQELWPSLPAEALDGEISKAEREQILGYGEHGV
ncbi:MAG: type II toxin-antitoxin system VapB family antitoxin [Gaiellaceae bacterium]|jgi:antitoxin VapB